MHEELEKQMIARFEEALELGYGSDPHRAVELLELLLQEVQEASFSTATGLITSNLSLR
jgi:hypothetical protein